MRRRGQKEVVDSQVIRRARRSARAVAIDTVVGEGRSRPRTARRWRSRASISTSGRASSSRSSARPAAASRRSCASSATSSQPTSGVVEVNGKPAHQARLERDYGMVFQAPVLFDWRTVEANVRLPLEVMGALERRAASAHRRDARARRADGLQAPLPAPALRWHAAARRHRPRAAASSPRSSSWTSRSGHSTR